MKKYLVFALFIGLVSSALAKQKKGEVPITLTEVSSSLSEFENDADKDFVKKDFVYNESGVQKYDDVFKESAKIAATIAQIDGTIGLIKEEKLILISDFAIKSIAFAVTDLPKMEKMIKNLQNKIKSLDPKADFKGLKARKAPKATSGIKLAGEQLADALNKLPRLIEDLSDITNKK